MCRSGVLFSDEDADLAKSSWSIGSAGYAQFGGASAGNEKLLHRVILARKLGRRLVGGENVDHVNGVKTDNRRDNLRLATKSENARNAGKRGGYGGRPCSSVFKGVCLHKPSRRWLASIQVPSSAGVGSGRTIYLGYFSDEADAARAYDDAALALHGEFAVTNFSTEMRDGA